MDAESMTPEELLSLAEKKNAERTKEPLKMVGGSPKPPTVRTVEVDGVCVDVDMRLIMDIRTIRELRKIERLGDRGGMEALDLFDRILGGQADRVIDAISDEDGFCSVEAYSTFVGHLFGAVGAKN